LYVLIVCISYIVLEVAILHFSYICCIRHRKHLHDADTSPNQINSLTHTQNSSFGWHLQFLTIIGLSLSTITFVFGLTADLTSTALSRSPVLPSDSPAAALSEHLFRLKNYLALVAAPIEVTISVLYWTLKAIDGKLLVPPDLPLPPAIYDIGFHLVPAVVLALDYILLSPPWPTTPMNESAPIITLSISTVIAFGYWIWIVRYYLLLPQELLS
jgi:hypothetical protein